MTTSLSIVLKRTNKIYHEGEILVGVVVVESAGEARHEGLTLTLEGAVNLQLSPKHAGLFDAFSNNLKPITLLNTCMELSSAGKIPAGVTEIPFELPLASRGAALPETYHGVFISVMYALKCNMKRSLFNKPCNTACQFFVQYRPTPAPPPKPVRCTLAPPAPPADAAGTPAAPPAPPAFLVHVELESTACALDRPITGTVVVERSAARVRSLELQLVRVETCGRGLRDATEVQNIQLAEGDVRRGAAVPMHMVLPRLFVCPSLLAPAFRIEFELNVAVVFEDDLVATENIPVLLLRCN